MKYPIVFTPSISDDGYDISVPDLPGCIEKSTTIDLGLEKIRQNMAAHLSILAEYGEAIPHANAIDRHQSKVSNGIWAIIDIDISPYLGKSHKINVTLPELLIKQIDDRVSKSAAYKTRSAFIATACIGELSK